MQPCSRPVADFQPAASATAVTRRDNRVRSGVLNFRDNLGGWGTGHGRDVKEESVREGDLAEGLEP